MCMRVLKEVRVEVRVLAGGFFGVVWLLPLILLVCLSFFIFMCLTDNVAKVK